MKISKLGIKLATATAACLLAACPVANAALSIVSSVGGAPTGVNKLNFDDLALGVVNNVTAIGPNGTVDITTTPDAAVVQNSLSGQYAAPFLSGGNGNGFGPLSGNQANGEDTTHYLTSGSYSSSLPNAAVTLTFTSYQKYFGLLWGSVDSYNTLSFYKDGAFVGSLTGTDVTPTATGDQGLNGTFYVNINSDLEFNEVVATSSQKAFEFDNVAYSATPVPEPTTMIAGVLLLLPFGASTLRGLRKTRTA